MLDIFGPASLERGRGLGDETLGKIEHAYRHSQVTRIYAGTSEIHRSIIAEAGLGPPADPRRRLTGPRRARVEQRHIAEAA